MRGNNPLCLVEFPHTGLFVYASTSEILQNAISRLDFLQAQPFSRVWLEEGEILHLSADGQMETRTFDTRRLQSLFYAPWGWASSRNSKRTLSEDLLNTAATWALKRRM